MQPKAVLKKPSEQKAKNAVELKGQAFVAFEYRGRFWGQFLTF